MAMKTVTMGLADAVSYAYGEISSLAEEVREVVDSAEGGRAETQRIQTLGETADTLENISEPNVPETLAQIQVSFLEIPSGKRGLSRAKRRDNATSAMSGVVAILENLEDEALQDEADELRDQVENDQSEAEGAEFPGMFG